MQQILDDSTEEVKNNYPVEQDDSFTPDQIEQINEHKEIANAKGQFDNAQNVVPFVIATPRKRNEHCILISHNLTQDCLGGCTGMSEPIKTQTYRLNLKTTPQGKPLFKGILEGLVDNDGNELEEHKISLPGWLRPEIIYGHFNGKPITHIPHFKLKYKEIRVKIRAKS